MTDRPPTKRTKWRFTPEELANKPWLPKEVPVKRMYSSWGPMISNHWMAAEIANCIHCWARIERDLCEVFAYTIDSDNWTAAEILSEVRKFRPKVAILIRGIQRKFGQELATKAKALLRLALEFSGERDVLAHGVFIDHQDYKNCVVRIDGWTKTRGGSSTITIRSWPFWIA